MRVIDEWIAGSSQFCRIKGGVGCGRKVEGGGWSGFGERLRGYLLLKSEREGDIGVGWRVSENVCRKSLFE